MENNSNTWTPIQWEDHYLQELQNDVNNQMSYSNQIMQNMMNGFYYGPNDQLNMVNQMKSYRQHLEGYNNTSAWFLDRNLHRFPDFLNAVKLDMDKAIGTTAQTYQGSVKSQIADNDYAVKARGEIDDIYKKMNDDRIASYKKTNDMWSRYFNS